MTNPNGWRDISTAKKDKKWLLLHGDGPGFMHCTVIGYWGKMDTNDPLKFGDEACWRRTFGGDLRDRSAIPADLLAWDPRCAYL